MPTYTPITEEFKKTITYSEDSQGFPSFYSYNPDYIIGMNQFLYTFKNGNLYRHNTNNTRNEYYGEQFPAQIESVFNDQPLENKIFKTLNLEGDDAWSAKFTSDIQIFGEIDADYFVQKEGAWFAFLRSNSPTGGVGATASIPAGANLNLRSINGIGQSIDVDSTDPANIVITFNIDKPLGSIYNLGDLVYLKDGGNTPVFIGTLVDVVFNTVAFPNLAGIVVNSTNAGTYPAPQPTAPLPIPGGFFFTLKNPVAESHGILGHYGIFQLEIEANTASELFVVESEVMKSFP